jgi:hypothetical protein
VVRGDTNHGEKTPEGFNMNNHPDAYRGGGQ